MIYFTEAFAALAANRLRTLLSLAGLVVGVGAVISIQLLGTAMTGATTGIFQGLSNYTFLIYPNAQNGFDRKSAVSFGDIAKLQAIPNVRLAIPYDQKNELVRFEHNTAQLSLSPVGAQAEFFSQPLAAGRLLSEDAVTAGSRACVISDNAFTKLSPNGTPLIGEIIRAGPLACQVVGVLEKLPSGAQNFNFGADIYVPYTLFERRYLPSRAAYQIEILVDDVNRISETEAAVKSELSAAKNGKFTYQAFDNFFLAQLIGKVFGTLSLIVSVIAGIALIVSGIGIMNILLVSISERTREIGIRKAVGAQRSQIMAQFFLEAALLTFAGCGLGAALGIAVGSWINAAYIIKISGVIVAVPWLHAVALAIAFAAAVTFGFGTFPAYRAAGLDPIEALRYE